MKNAPDCRNSAAERAGRARWACSIASAAEARAHADGAAGDRNRVASAGTTRRRSARAYSAEAEYHWSRSPGASSATRCGGSVAGRDHRGRVAREAGELVVLGPVVGDEQRQRRSRAASAGLQIRDRDVRAAARGARTASSLDAPVDAVGASHAGGS